MAKIESAFFDISTLDRLASRDNPLNRLDPRVKVVTTLLFIVAVVSSGKYEVSALLPFFLFPCALIAVADLPLDYLLKKLLIAAPFALLVGVFNPFFDPAPQLQLNGFTVSGGWLSFTSIMLRFTLTVSAALILVATTSFTGVCLALERLGAPRVFVLQLLFLYRYLFVLIDEGARLNRALTLRSFNGRGRSLKVLGSLLGQLLLRTLDRAQRIHMAMLCRGFDGEVLMSRQLHIGGREVLFAAGWACAFLLFRTCHLPQSLGLLIERLME
jgi:cobalt/nickel transport system permease protein